MLKKTVPAVVSRVVTQSFTRNLSTNTNMSVLPSTLAMLSTLKNSTFGLKNTPVAAPHHKLTAQQHSVSTSGTTANNSSSTVKHYVSPYEIKSPLQFIVIHNRSNNAVNFAIRKLKEAWPELQIIQVVHNQHEPIYGADHVVRITDWTSMSDFKTQFDKLAVGLAPLRHSMAKGLVGFYPVYSTQAEDPVWARQAIAAGFQWIGAAPETMEGLEKIEYKNKCTELGIPTAPYVVLDAPKQDIAHATPEEKEATKESAIQHMAQQLVERHQASPELANQPVFVKHNNGGGGRGSKKVQHMNLESALEAIRKVVKDTGGNVEGVYAELALDFEGALVQQIEIERDATSAVKGARLVYFNRENQKVSEFGFTDESILEFLPREVYAACRDASSKLFAATPYNNRGTNEMLIVKDKHGQWKIYALEFNKRVQVENEALNNLYCDHLGRIVNVPAEQVMRSLGYPAPQDADRRPTGVNVMVHLRLLSSNVTADKGSLYHNDVIIDGAFYPQDADVQFVPGAVNITSDPQIGRALIKATHWEDACDKLADFASKFQFYGYNTEKSTYFDFIRKLAANPRFRAKSLGCNQTIEVLADTPVEPGVMQKVMRTLTTTVTPMLIADATSSPRHGYRPGAGIEGQADVTPVQLKNLNAYMDDLAAEPISETPFSRFLNHQDYNRYILELKSQLDNHGGGTISVMRDVLQSSFDQESALIQPAMTQIAERLLAATGFHVGNEQGGAQYQSFLVRNGDWMAALEAGLPANMPAHSLTRSKWLNGLKAKPREYQAFYFNVIAAEVCRHYGVSTDMKPFIPWMPYNFHAGNHPRQDITTREMLRAGLAVIPSWAWDPRYTHEHFTGWVNRQIDTFEQENKPLSQIRIKNPGQGPDWTADVMVDMVQTIRQIFASRDLSDPLIMIHNHNFAGADVIAAEAIRRCQRDLKYSFLIMDSAPPGTSHNSNLIIARQFKLTAEEREKLIRANLGNHLLLQLVNRFNNQQIINVYQDPYSLRAGGTNSSDISSMNEMKIALKYMNEAITLGRVSSGLGTEVTPNSEFIKLLGMAIWKCDGINPKTPQAVIDYIHQGGQLEVSLDVLIALQEWETLLPRPAIVDQLLINHGMTPHPKNADALMNKPLDIEAERAKLQSKIPRTKVTDRVLSTVVGFDDIGQNSLIARDTGLDITPLMSCPEFVHNRHKKVGDSFTIYGKKVTVLRLVTNEKAGTVEVDFNVSDRIIRMYGIDPNPKKNAAVKKVQLVTDKKREIGAPWTGRLNSLFVVPDQVLKKGDEIASLEAMKQTYDIRATADMEGKKITTVLVKPGDNVEVDEVIATFKPS